MASRLELQTKLEELLNSENVYYQPPASKQILYPAIVYSKSDIVTYFADDKPYAKHRRYEITVIDRRPDNEVIDKLLDVPYCAYDRHFVSDNLHHDVFTLFF